MGSARPPSTSLRNHSQHLPRKSGSANEISLNNYSPGRSWEVAAPGLTDEQLHPVNSRGCGHNRDDETLFSAGPNQPLWCLDWHRAGRRGCGNRLLQRRRYSTSSPQPTGHQRAQGLGEVCAAGLGWWRTKEYQHRMRAKATPLDLGSG